MKKQILTTMLLSTIALGSLAPAATSTVLAADNGTITIESTQKGAVYSAYKIFDATVADPAINNGAVSYTVPADRVDTYKASANFDTLFTLTTNGGVTYVTKKDSATDSQIAEWAKSVSAGQTPANTVTEDAAGTAELSVPYGYYYVGTTANNGATIMVTSASPNATIREKNNEPTWGDVDNQGKSGKSVDDKVKAVGETVTYTLNYTNATYYTKGNKVYQYVVKDALPTGVDFNEGSVKVEVNGQVLTEGTGKTTYILNQSDNGFSVTIPWAATQTATTATGDVVGNQTTAATLGDKDDFYYNPISTIKVTYTATMLKAASEGSTETDTNKNTAYINPNELTTDKGSSATVYDGQITIDKVAAGTDKKLKAAKFVLRKKGTEEYLKLADTTENVTWVGRDTAQVFTTDTQGAITISGLDEGEYELLETEAPAGYNLLKEPVAVKLAFDENIADGDTLLVTSKVANKQGAELPSTGGMGTKIFYILGTVLVIGGSVVLIARRRARN